jgi:hypothetical protein
MKKIVHATGLIPAKGISATVASSNGNFKDVLFATKSAEIQRKLKNIAVARYPPEL